MRRVRTGEKAAMLNRSAFPPALAAESNDPKGSTEPVTTVAASAIARLFQLPTSFQGYLVFLFCLLVLAFTMVLHVTLSAEIMRLNVQLYDLQAENQKIERHNANQIWQIAQRSSLADAYKTATEQGYTSTLEEKYVVREESQLPQIGVEPIASQSEPQQTVQKAEPSFWARTQAWRSAPAEWFSRAGDWLSTQGAHAQSLWAGGRAWFHDRTGW